MGAVLKMQSATDGDQRRHQEGGNMRADSAYCEHKVFSQMNIPGELEMQGSALLLLLFNTKIK